MLPTLIMIVIKSAQSNLSFSTLPFSITCEFSYCQTCDSLFSCIICCAIKTIFPSLPYLSLTPLVFHPSPHCSSHSSPMPVDTSASSKRRPFTAPLSFRHRGSQGYFQANPPDLPSRGHTWRRKQRVEMDRSIKVRRSENELGQIGSHAFEI